MRERMLDLAIDPLGIIDLDGSVLYATRVDGCDAEQLVAQADHAMYTAKAAGAGGRRW